MRSRVGAAFRRVVLSAAVLAACAPPLHAGHYAWTTSGPVPGPVSQILIDPQDPTRLVVAAGFFTALLFQSSDRGQSWIQNPAVAFNGRFVQDPSHGSTLYTYGYLGSASGVLKSPDFATTWAETGPGLPGSPYAALAVSRSNPLTFYALFSGSPGPLYRSDDGAASWSLVGNAFPAVNVVDLQVDPADPSILYATANTDVVKSIDGGVSWQSTGLGHDTYRIVIDPANPQRVFAGTSGSGVYLTVNGGATWAAANVGIETAYVRDLLLDPSDPQTLWMASTSTDSSGGVFVTRNAHDWSRIDFGENILLGTAIAVDPSDSGRIYASAGHSPLVETLFTSPDGGTTWSHADSGLSGFSNGGVEAHLTDGTSAFTTDQGSIFHTSDSGSHWSLLADTGFALLDFAQDPSSPGTLYAGYVIPDFSGNGMLKSVDGGATWDPTTGDLSVNTLHRVATAPSAAGHVLAASFDGLFQTIDGGDVWTPIRSTGADVRSCAYDPLDASILYAGEYGSLQRSQDGGMTWQTPDGLPGQAVNNWDLVAPSNDSSRVYLATAAGVYRSLDRGLSFEPAGTGLPPPPAVNPYRLAADPSRAGTLYLLAMLGGGAVAETAVPANVFRTTSGGDAWSPLPGALPQFGNSDLSVSADGRTLYASTISGTFQFRRSFLDVPDDDVFWSAVDAAAMNGVTAGCGGGNFCPDDIETRAAMAVFLLRGKNGAAYAPPPATGTVFGDVPLDSPSAPYIEELFHEGVTAGCGSGDYCPDSPLTRAEASVLLLKMEHGPDYEPPPATGTVFADVPADAFAAAWIEQLALEGITAGCGGGDFCPDAAVSRAQAAAFVVHTFGLS